MIEHWPRAGDHARGSHWDQNGIKQSMSRSRDQNKLRATKSRAQQSFSDTKEVWLLFCSLNLCKSRAIKQSRTILSLDPSCQFSMQVTNPCHGFVSTQQGLLLLT